MFDNEKALIEKACLDYVEGYFQKNTERIQDGVHAQLLKRSIDNDQLIDMTRDQLLYYAGINDSPMPEIKVEVFGIYGNVASAVIYSTFVDFVHLARVNGRWQVINVIWGFL